ncbi:1-phosphofructokinase family hexose kinase [Mesobacterium pallidum]|uniref:1-phosphofructokinase family hexose kinase n=1 Tax=Mesobacterium pallidum TaxID=2872037 RepID=UPI001EE24FA9|nr:hexose kinase [Mesobacterium pallidum]
MRPILTITLNPALDLASAAPGIRPGPKLRCTPPTRDPGGGGLNVSRAIAHMGGTSRALAALGGPNGEAVAGLLAAEGIDLIPLPAPGETRLSLAVTDSDTGGQYRFVLPGPDWSGTDPETLIARIAADCPQDALVVLSGSQPAGLPDDLPQRMVAPLGSARLIVDTSGAPLMTLGRAPRAGAAPWVLRMDHAEAGELTGETLDSAEKLAAAAQAMVGRGVAETVILAFGKDGSVMAGRELPRPLHGVAPYNTIVSTVGAGDSFVGGFTLATARGDNPAEALRMGVAAASAAVQTPATELCRAEDVARIAPLVRVTEIAL